MTEEVSAYPRRRWRCLQSCAWRVGFLSLPGSHFLEQRQEEPRWGPVAVPVLSLPAVIFFARVILPLS